MLTPETALSNYFLFPSTLYASTKATVVQTVLGSCVALCLFDTRLQIGGINHYMLPYWSDQGLATPKYGNIAIPKLVEKMVSLGSDHQSLVAKVFGGAHQLTESNVYEIGKRNVEVAFDLLSERKIKVLKSDTGGTKGRNIKFVTNENLIMLKYV
jgi:chemotaxis protein CheD